MQSDFEGADVVDVGSVVEEPVGAGDWLEGDGAFGRRGDGHAQGAAGAAADEKGATAAEPDGLVRETLEFEVSIVRRLSMEVVQCETKADDQKKAIPIHFPFLGEEFYRLARPGCRNTDEPAF